MRSLTALTCLIAALTTCAPPPRDDVRIGADVDAGSLDPRLMRDTTAYRVVNLLYDGLVELDATLSPAPGLATEWEQSSPTTWTFRLRDDAVFHDGTPLSAHDVVHTFETLLDPGFGATLRNLYAPIVEVRADDEHTVTFVLDEPYAPLLSYLDIGIVPRHTDDIVGTGPYVLERWDRGHRIVLTAHREHWSGAPSIPRVEFVVVPDNTARAQAFEAGDLDVIQSPLSPQDIERLRGDERFHAFVMESPSITYFNFNTARAPFDEPAARRAVSMLIDQETILGEIYQGADAPARSILLPSSWAFSPDAFQPGYDPDAAAALLSGLGPLSFELGTHSEDLNRVQTIELLQHRLGQHDIDVTVHISDWPSFSVRRDAGDYDAILLGWTQLVDPDRVLFDQLHSAGGLNWGAYRNERLDALLEAGRSAVGRDERAEIYRSAAAIVGDELPYYVLSYQGYQAFTSRRLEGFAPDPRGMLRSITKSRVAHSNQ